MLITLDTLAAKYPLKINGVLHIGAHEGEEAADYQRHKVGPVWWVEANPKLIPKLQRLVQRYPDNHLIEGLVTDRVGELRELNVTNNVMSSSIFPLGTHAVKAPQVKYIERVEMRTTTIDDFTARYDIHANFLNMDIQGAELLALRGGERFIPEHIDYLFMEFNQDELYVGCGRLWELDDWLRTHGYIRVETSMAQNHVGWGDCFAVRLP